MRSKKYYRDLDILRVLACVAIFLYHLNILKGGYLAVCIFFVLSGYLSCVSSFKKEKFSILSYYGNRLLKLYLPLIIVTFLSIFVISFFSEIKWLNLKPETTSVLLGYNNFWQSNANLDYFARHINSPFMHFWFIAIILQFDLIFPLVFKLLKKIGDKIHEALPCIIAIVLGLGSTIYLFITSLSANTPELKTVIYYNSFARVFSLLFGLGLGFVHCYYSYLTRKRTNKKYKIISRAIFYAYVLATACLCIFTDDSSPYFGMFMIAASLMTCRLICYAVENKTDNNSIITKITKSLSSISYEVYLFQYPIIFLMQYINIDNGLKTIIIVILTILLASVTHFSLDFKKKNDKFKFIRIFLCIIITCPMIYGGYLYIISEDHTAEMKELETQLAQNATIFEGKQEEYATKIKEEEAAWKEKLASLENSEAELKEMVTNLPVVGVGDSVMLGAVSNLYQQFPNGYYDAKVSRTAWVVSDILLDLKARNMLGNPVVLNLGANGDCPEYLKEQIVNICEDREVFWVNVTNDEVVHVNASLKAFEKKKSNVHVVDWNSISYGHSEYFYSDGIHLTGIGRVEYTKAIFDAIYNFYLEDYTKKREEALKEHEELLKTKISFYGNDLLLNAYENVQESFENAGFNIDKEFNFEKLISTIKTNINDNTLTYKLVFAFDSNFNITLEEYEELINLCENHDIYIVSINQKTNSILDKIEKENVKIIDFYKEINQKPEYLMVDDIHLTTDGNKALTNILKEIIE